MTSDSAVRTDSLGLGATAQPFAVTRAEAAKAAVFAVAFGAFLVFLTGFAPTDALHNGAHNTRHALSFPCH